MQPRQTHTFQTTQIGPRPFPRAAVAALLLLLACVPALRAQPQTPTGPTPLDRLTAPDTPAEDRAAAAAELIRLPADSPVLPVATALLSDATPNPARALLAALTREPQPAAHWFAPTAALARADSPLTAEAIEALGSFRTRDAAAVLVEIVADTRPPELQDVAARSLARLSGRTDIAPSRWQDWLAEALTLTDRQWEQRLLRDHIQRVQALQAAAIDRDHQLVEAERQVHLLTPLDQRSELLARLLQSGDAPLRDLGFELVAREIGENRQLQPSVAHAAVALLSNRDASVRAQAALLVDRLAPPDAAPAVLAALERETDPRTADALLRAASRWPSAALVKPALRWLNGSPALRVRAAAAAWILLRDGYLAEQADREAVLAGVRAIETPALSAPACRILATLGDETDLARLHDLLAAAEPTTRATAADALALRADQVDTLLAAATDDATLFEATARSLRAHLHDARGYAALSRLPAPSPQIRARVLADYATLLPTEEIIRLARLASDPTEALHLLRPLTAPERAADPTTAPQLADGLLLLAQTAITLNNPTDALNALALIPAGTQPAEPRALADLRAMLLLWLNRIDDAVAIDASPNAWLDALDHALTEPHAQAIIDGLGARFPELSREDTARLETLRQRLADAATPPDPTEGG